MTYVEQSVTDAQIDTKLSKMLTDCRKNGMALKALDGEFGIFIETDGNYYRWTIEGFKGLLTCNIVPFKECDSNIIKMIKMDIKNFYQYCDLQYLLNFGLSFKEINEVLKRKEIGKC